MPGVVAFQDSSHVGEELSSSDWIDELDKVGPFVELSELRDLRDSVPQEDRSHNLFHWLEGLIMGRSINEELGGL